MLRFAKTTRNRISQIKGIAPKIDCIVLIAFIFCLFRFTRVFKYFFPTIGVDDGPLIRSFVHAPIFPSLYPYIVPQSK